MYNNNIFSSELRNLESYTHFDGSSKIYGTIPQDFTAAYEVHVKLRLTLTEIIKSTDTKITPPMPFLISSLAFYKLGKTEYKVYLKDDFEYNFSIKNSGWYSIVFRADKLRKKTSLYINSNLVHIAETYLPVSGNYTIGCGHHERYWKGDISTVKIISFNDKNIPNILVNLDPPDKTILNK